jgi:hypothetical protein
VSTRRLIIWQPLNTWRQTSAVTEQTMTRRNVHKHRQRDGLAGVPPLPAYIRAERDEPHGRSWDIDFPGPAMEQVIESYASHVYRRYDE